MNNVPFNNFIFVRASKVPSKFIIKVRKIEMPIRGIQYDIWEDMKIHFVLQ